MLEMFVIQHRSIWPNFVLITFEFKRNKHKCNFYYVAMPMTTSQILKSGDFTKTQNLDISYTYIEKEIFFLQIKNFIKYTSRASLLLKIVFQRKSPLNMVSYRNASTKIIACFTNYSFISFLLKTWYIKQKLISNEFYLL